MIASMLNRIKTFIGFTLGLVILSACSGAAEERSTMMNEESPQYLSSLMWVKTADAAEDAKAAIEQKDFRLWVAAGRGERAPGLDNAMAGELKERCGVKYIQGSTDALRSSEHKALLKQAYQYAGDYNAIIAKHCTKNS